MPSRSAAEKLPVPLTSLLGRERDLAETERLLGGTRLLTLTGAGGSGKTRLAVELARRATQRFDDVVWVDLAPLDDPELIPEQLLGALGLREIPDADAVEVIIESLESRHALLVFDNCEHLVDACAALAETILRRCPAVSILTTTREALGIGGEQTWLVPPLAERDAMELFAERARSVSPSFALTDDNTAAVARICQRLDGIPLAIELAAARVKVLTVDQIAERLADAFRLLSSGSRTLPRHRTIRETIDWSFRLLSEDEQILLRRLAVFSGSFSLSAAEAICDDVDVLGGVAALVDKSLLMVADDGYRLLETVRQFAAEKLEQAGEKDAYRERHARYFSQLVESLEPKLFAGAVDLPTVALIDREIGNIRAVFEWAEEAPARTEVELRLIYALHWWWFARAHFHEARRRINAAVARLKTADVDPLVKARAYIAHGDAAIWQADWDAIRPGADEAVEILRDSNDTRALSMALLLLGTAMAFGEDAEAEEVIEQAVAVARRHGRDVGLGLALYWSGVTAQLRGDLRSARASFEEALQLGRDINNLPAMGHALTVLGHLSLVEGKRDEAVRAFREAIDVHAQTDDRWGLTQVVEGIGIVLLDSGDAETGTRLLAAASAAWLQLGARPGRNEDKDERIRQALANQKLRVVLASGAGLSYDAMVALARERVAGTAAAATTSMLRVRALGPLEIELNGEAVDAGRSRELLLYLLSHPAGATKEQIGAALWPDADPAKLRNNFHVTVHRLRKVLGGADWVLVDGETYSLKPGIDFDVSRFERDAKAKDPAHLARAIELYRGDFFENATSDGEWYLDTRDRLRDLYARALSTLGRLSTAAGDHATAADAFQRLVALDEFDEEAARNLMTALAKQGDTAGAARVYKRLAEALRKELETEPEPATRKLFQSL